jgi:hypothetical protein
MPKRKQSQEKSGTKAEGQKKAAKSELPHGLEELASEVLKQRLEEENLFQHFKEKRKQLLDDLKIDEVIKHRSELVTELMSNPGSQRRKELIEKIRDLDEEYIRLME